MRLKGKIKNLIYGNLPEPSRSFPYFKTKVFFPRNSLIFRLACEQGIYEQDNTFLLRSLVKPNSVYFDVGANIGLLSIPILEFCDSCTVVSFEPSPNTFQYLYKTAQHSHFGNRWKVIDKAVGDKVGSLDFHTANGGMDAFNGFLNTERVDMEHSIQVPVTTLDVEWEKLGKPRVSAIKMDIEGAEFLALKGAKFCIQKERPFILLEWNLSNLKPYNIAPETLLQFAENNQYRVLGLPTLIPILDKNILLLYMCKTESFLLVPVP